MRKYPSNQLQKKGTQFRFIQFEEARKAIAVSHPATNAWRPLRLGAYMLLQIPIDHIHRRRYTFR